MSSALPSNACCQTICPVSASKQTMWSPEVTKTDDFSASIAPTLSGRVVVQSKSPEREYFLNSPSQPPTKKSLFSSIQTEEIDCPIDLDIQHASAMFMNKPIQVYMLSKVGFCLFLNVILFVVLKLQRSKQRPLIQTSMQNNSGPW